jgi:hypothetical protein
MSTFNGTSYMMQLQRSVCIKLSDLQWSTVRAL